MAGVPAASIAGNMVVTPDMVPPNPAPYDEEAKFFNTLADDAEETQKQWQGSNSTRTQSAQSPGFEEGHEKNRQTAADFGRLAGVYRDAASYYSSVAGVYRDAHRSQQSAINNANNELRQAKTPAQQQAIIARWHAHARSLTNSAIAEAAQKVQTFRTNAGSSITALDSLNKGTAPQAPALPQSGGNGIAVPVGKTGSGLPDEGDPGETGPMTTGPAPTLAVARQPLAKASGNGHYKRGQVDGTDGTPGGAPDATALRDGTRSPVRASTTERRKPSAVSRWVSGPLVVRGWWLEPTGVRRWAGGLGSGGGLSGLTSGGLPGSQAAGLGRVAE